MPDDSPTQANDALSRRAMLVAGAGASLGVAPAFAPTAAAQPSSAQHGRPGEGKVALVTGSSRGIGAATARRLARDGYRVTVNCLVSRDLAAQVVRDIEAEGSKAIWEQADVADPAAVARLFAANDRAFGGVDVVVSNAGIMNLAPMAQMTDAAFDRMFATNAKGSFNVLREGARRVRDGGRIITLSSTVVQFRGATFGPYAATKAIQQIYANILAKELAGRGISVNSIAPGQTNTPLFTNGRTKEQIQQVVDHTPLGHLGQPEDIADVIAALCSRDAGWVNGQTIYANGGII